MAQYIETSNIYHRENHQQFIPTTQFYTAAILKENKIQYTRANIHFIIEKTHGWPKKYIHVIEEP
jgi:hypothetical protein